jgi:FMN phosphatase YigB (HAD superfamily)
MNKKVAFDIGNVLCHVDLERFYNYLVNEQKLFSTNKEAIEFFEGIQIGMDLGLYDVKKAFYEFSHNYSKNKIKVINYFLIENVWIDCLSISDEVLGLLDDLFVKGYQIALLSNIGFDHATFINNKTQLSYCIKHFSYEIGTRKPAKLFYMDFVSKHNWTNDVLFFDDRQENVDASKKYLNGTLFNLDDFNNDKEAVSFLKTKLEL